MDTVRKLKSKMTLYGMNMEKLAAAIDVNPSTLYRWFNSNCRSAPLESLRQIAVVLHLTRDEFMDIFLPMDLQECE